LLTLHLKEQGSGSEVDGSRLASKVSRTLPDLVLLEGILKSDLGKEVFDIKFALFQHVEVKATLVSLNA